jgi:hypothetical protein
MRIPCGVEADKTVYFLYTSLPFCMVFEVAEDQQEAAQTVRGLKEQK